MSPTDHSLQQAREFSDRHYGMSRASQSELAALLDSVRADTLAEVRRVVDNTASKYRHYRGGESAGACADEILAELKRLEGLK